MHYAGFNLCKITKLILFIVLAAFSQVGAQTVPINSGLWQAFDESASLVQYPELNGRLSNFAWKDIEPDNNLWNWSIFDSTLTNRVKDSLPVMFMVYTYEEAPEWLYSNGVPKVTVTDDTGAFVNYAPYFKDTEYKDFFKRMITAVRNHVDSLPYAVRKWIIGVQACFGSTGDYLSYKGNVPAEYYLSDADCINLYKEFTKSYYNAYKTTNPKIYLISNPNNADDSNPLYTWTNQNCPKGWFKTGTIGKGFQLNDEAVEYVSLYPLLNNLQNGEYVRARCEITAMLGESWFYTSQYQNMFALFTNMIFWGVDWSNQGSTLYSDTGYAKAYNFYNKYAGQKNPFDATNALCAFKDGLDASDESRFPASTYGLVVRTNTSRFTNIANAFAAYGAKEEDPYTATLSGFGNLFANGTNDVGWSIFTTNYERWLHQLNPSATSVGYWNVVAANDTNSMYGKYARGFDVAAGKNTFYFDIENSFLRNKAVNGEYPISIDITYLDKGTGGFKLFYDSQTETNKFAGIVRCMNTNTWKTATFLIHDGYFKNRASSTSDFYIKTASNTQDVIFSHIELSKPKEDLSDVGLVISGSPVFDTVCYKGMGEAKTFHLSGHLLNGSKVYVGPMKGFKFSTSLNGTYYDTLTFKNYGSSITQTIYIKFAPLTVKTYVSSIPIFGGGAKTVYLIVTATSVFTSPLFNASITPISCYNYKNGVIDLSPSGGKGPFSYKWTKASSQFWTAVTEDISGLAQDTYTVELTSSAACVSTASYTITQPDILVASIKQDSLIICKGGSTTVTISATGGTTPYNGTGAFSQSAGYKRYTVTDARGCVDNTSISISQGTQVVPGKPATINADDAISRGICNGGDYVFSTTAVNNATSYIWTLPAGSNIVSSQNNGLNITAHIPPLSANATAYVKAANVCGSSKNTSKNIYALPAKPSVVIGLNSVQSGATGLTYSVNNVPGLNYSWSVPKGVTITSGQNTNSITVNWGTRAGNVSVKAQNNCGSSASSALYVNISSLIAASGGGESSSAITIASVNGVTVNPNPAKDMFIVMLGNKAVISSISLYTTEGKLILQKKINSSFVRVTKNELGNQPGVYFIDVVSGTQHYKQKVVVL